MAEAPVSLSLPDARRRRLSIAERRLFLMAIDAFGVIAAFVLAFNLHTAEVRNTGLSIPRVGVAIVLGLWIVSGCIANTWNLRAANSMRTTLPAVSSALGMTLLGLLAVFFVVPYRITRPTLLLWAPLAWILVMSGRLFYRKVVATPYFAGRIALVADGDAMARVWPEVHDQIRGLYRVVAVVNPTRVDCADQLYGLVQSRQVDHVVLGVRDDVDRDLFRGLLACHDAGVRVRSLADLYEEITGRLLLDQLGHTWLLGLPMRNQTSFAYAAFKRVLDVTLAALTLVVLGVLLLPLAVAIKLDGGPLFHRQTRVGKHGRTFVLFKLRTMRHVPHRPTTWTEHRDSRITPVGRVLRRLHADELPQGWSILRGHMSLIGPRPEQPQYVDQLRAEIDFYNTRLTVRPGLTGWAQVHQGYGSGVDAARVKLSYDLYYVKHQSASLDLLILARTLMSILSLNGR